MKIIKIIFILGLSLNSFAQIPFRLPAIFSDHAVLQQSSEIKIWGWGPGSLKVAIVCSWSPLDTISALIGADCRWEANVNTPKAGGSYSIEFRCDNQVTKIEDILIGEVWLCSGQSNMELPTKVGILDDADVLKNCYNNQIRFFEVVKDFDKYPKSECMGEWKICDSATLSSFSAVAYFFGRRLNSTLNAPVGLIGSYWGGTHIGSWCSNEVVENDSALQNNNREGVPYAPQANSIIYNAMIFPLAPYKLAGVIWYQGESNVRPDPETYGTSFANMIYDWRQLFEAKLPFYFVQIAPFRGFYPGIYSAYLREQQEAALVVPKTGMITIGDLAEIDVTDIHPRSKAGVGLRLANLALREVYKKNDIQPYFPRFEEADFSKNIAKVKVNSLGRLKYKGEEIRSFAVAGNDRKFYDASAKIEKDGTITISSKEVQLPVAVRYCFTNDQVPNLFDANGLPLMPFRTDRWELSLRTWQGIPGIERSAKGRVFVSWYTGGEREPSPEQIVLLCYSDDNGITFNEPQIMGAQKNGARCYDPRLWIDPNGRLWYIFNRSNKETAVHGVYARICNNPDLAIPVFGEEFRVGFDVPYAFGMNKPTVLSSGEWIMPVTYATDSIHDWFAGSKQLQGVGISGDKGKTWKLFGSVKAPEWALEPMITELKDGRLWMLIRTGSGFLWESYSNNKGQTWSEAKTTSIADPGSRFFIRRLASGNLLLVNHYKYSGRSHITARISTDEGATWNEGLLLDERGGTIYANGVIGGVSYPDGVQDKKGLIWIVYDRNRNGEGEILLAKFREEDVLAHKNVSGAVTLKQVINRLEKPKLLPAGWDPKEAADKVMARLIKVTAPEVKGAHDAGLTIKGDHAFIVSMVNDLRAGENAAWPEIYLTLSIVNLKTLVMEKNIPFAKGGQVFENDTLQIGACFVPRILLINDTTLRCFFASENPGVRQSQTFYRDFLITRQKFEDQIQKVKIKTFSGIFDMQPQYLYADAKVYGFTKPATDFGLYLIDAFKLFDGKIYAVLNNFSSGQNSLALVHHNGQLFEVIGHYNLPNELKLSESSVNRLPDGTWMAICRQDGGNNNYLFTYSTDGKIWSPGKELPIILNGANSKPTFDKFGGVYYLGWQEATKIQGVYRSVFNVDISRDGKNWERKYRFESEKSFQYPSFYEYNGNIWLTVTQGDTDVSRKERIMFGKLE